MSESRAEFGNRALTDPAVTRQLNGWLEEDERLEQQMIRAENERLYLQYVKNWFRRTDRQNGV